MLERTKTIAKPLRAAGVLLGLLVVLPVPVSATTLVRRSPSELASTADAVVRARVARVGTLVRRGRGVETHVVLEQVRWWRGAGDDDLTLLQHGGVHAGGGSRVDGQAVFRRGDDVVVFLRRTRDGWRPLGMATGVYHVRRRGGRLVAERQAGDAHWVDRRRAPVAPESPLPLPRLREIVVAAGAGR